MNSGEFMNDQMITKVALTFYSGLGMALGVSCMDSDSKINQFSGKINVNDQTKYGCT